MTATWRIDVGDCRELLAQMDAESVQTCVTSPPYFGLREYAEMARDRIRDDAPLLNTPSEVAA